MLTTLNTASDFCNYLTKREELFGQQATIHAAGEEELLGCYLMSTSSDGTGHCFSVSSNPVLYRL